MIGANAPIGSGSGSSGSSMAQAGAWLSLFGAFGSAVGAFYSAKSAIAEHKSAALEMDLQSSLSTINAREAEAEAFSIIDSGQRSAGLAGLEYGAARGALRAAQGTSGFTASRELEASLEYAKQTDLSAIKSNAARAAAAVRMRGVNYRTAAASQSLSARNLRRSGQSINPWAAGAGSLLGSAGEVASKWAYLQERRR